MHDYPQNNDMSRSSTVLAGFMFGAVIGAGLALLMAPATGEETRRRLGETARRIGDNARQTLDKSRDTLNDIKEDAKSAIHSGREVFKRDRLSQETQTSPAGFSER